MHELSIVRDLLAQVERLACENEAHTVSRVVVGVGRLAGISSDTLAAGFHHLKADTRARTAELVTEAEQVLLRCASCGTERRLSNDSLRCRRCGLSAAAADHGHRHDALALGVGACPECGEALDGVRRPCAACGSTEVSIVAGAGIVLKSVELER